jgi:hypothetical protein
MSYRTGGPDACVCSYCKDCESSSAMIPVTITLYFRKSTFSDNIRIQNILFQAASDALVHLIQTLLSDVKDTEPKLTIFIYSTQLVGQ